MYQSVDDIEAGTENETRKEVNRLKVGAAVIVGIAMLVLVTVFSAKPSTTDETDEQSLAQQYAVYTKAITELHPALRRARLLDFVQNHPGHSRAATAQAQAAIIQQADDKDWLALQDIVFDPIQTQPAKIAALDLYEEMWGAVLLGSREEDVAALRQSLESGDEDNSESTGEKTEDFTPQKDRFDDSIDGTKLAGGVVIIERSYIPPPPPVAAPATVRRAARINPPRLRKDRRPRYPSRAQRRGVEAEVVLILNIDDEGDVRLTEVVSARAPRYRKDFIKAAERAALRTKFYPKLVNGKPVAASGIVKKYIFRIAD